jgi:hypothetical protein
MGGLAKVVAGLGAARAMIAAGCGALALFWGVGVLTGVIASCSSASAWWENAFWPTSAIGTATAMIVFGVRAWRREMNSLRVSNREHPLQVSGDIVNTSLSETKPR